MKRGRKSLDERLTQEQKDRVRELYPCTSNETLAKELGIHKDSLSLYARNHGLYKSAEYMHSIHVRMGKKSIGKGGYRFPKGHICVPVSEEANEIRKRRISEGIKEIWRKERLRVEYGLPQETKLRISSVPARIRSLRYKLRHKGYIIDDKKRIAYWDEHTKRSKVMEKRKAWYTFKNVNDVNETHGDTSFVPEPPPVNDFFLFT